MEEQNEPEQIEIELNNRGEKFTVFVDIVTANELLNGKLWDLL